MSFESLIIVGILGVVALYTLALFGTAILIVLLLIALNSQKKS